MHHCSVHCDMIKEFGKLIICVDSTHKTTGYNFHLTIVIIVDEYSKGYQVSWCLSNREDKILLAYYFEQVKKKIRTIYSGLCLMTLMDSIIHRYQYSIHIQKNPTSWHVDCAWKVP